MDNKEYICAIGFYPKNGSKGIYQKKYSEHDNYCLEVDFDNESIDYGPVIKADSKITQNFAQAENFVVLECVDRLLSKGYKPQNIVLEKTWPAGHGTSGRLDICVLRDDQSEYMLIECKTFGKEFEKELIKMNRSGGQLFTYFKFSNKADMLVLYTSHLRKDKIDFLSKIIKIEDEYRVGDVADFYDKWNSISNKAIKDNGVFDSWVNPYNFKSKSLTINSLKEIKPEDSSKIFNSFLEILRQNVVSDKPNAFNKIFTLFLCKIFDEKTHEGSDEELNFQWKEGIDDDISFQLRLADLYKDAMKDFLEKDVTDFSTKDFEDKYATLDESVKRLLLDEFRRLRLEKNNEFAIKEVYDSKSFQENATVVKQIVKLLQGYRIRYAKKQQYLSDFFEMLLTTGLKQESGQFFTAIPIAQFVIRSLPIDIITYKKLKQGKRDDLLPYIIDYAAGSGHFITESMHIIQKIIKGIDLNSGLIPDTKKKIQAWKLDPFDWASQYEYGIEKDYRLVKVAKVGCYLHGDGLANVIHSDGLAVFSHEDYKGRLGYIDNVFPQDNKQFDILISNPPYSVSAFKNSSRKYYGEKEFELYKYLSDQSSEIECLFIERAKQLLKDDGVAGIILPTSILSNNGIYTRAREIVLKYFSIIGITELGPNTFMATNTNTVVLFLKRRSNYIHQHIISAIDSFFINHQDVTIYSIEKPITKYLSYVWNNLSLNEYIKCFKGDISKNVESIPVFNEYKTRIKHKTQEELIKKIEEIEKEKILYFLLAYTQKVVLTKTGKKEKEKEFLGYEFSNRRGSEGIHSISKNKTIDECTLLYNPEEFEDITKASSYNYFAFQGKYPKIESSLKNNICYVNLVDLLTFDRSDFEKTISTSIKKKIKYEDIWNNDSLIAIQKIADVTKGTSITKSKVREGNIPVIAGGRDLAYYHNESNRSGNIITVSASGAYAGFINYFEEPIFASDCNTICSVNDDYPTKLIYYFLKSIQDTIYELQKGQAQPHVYKDDIEHIKIPRLEKGEGRKLLSQIETIEKRSIDLYAKIQNNKEQIESLFSLGLKYEQISYKLNNVKVFSLSIGKRVLASELKKDGLIPVYSANVNEVFGFIDKEILSDYSLPSVLWGIDGDWLVNIIPEGKPFYPTDHCGVIRILDENIEPKYFAWALEKKGHEINFSRTLRASIDRMEGITISLPPYQIQSEVIAKVDSLLEQNKYNLLQIEKCEKEIYNLVNRVI